MSILPGVVASMIGGGAPPPPPMLSALTLSATSFVIGDPASGVILGATSGSTITASGLPAGFTINGAARTWAWSGVGVAGNGNLTLTEAHPDAGNSPRASTIGWTIVEVDEPVPDGPMSDGYDIILIGGDSNSHGLRVDSYAGSGGIPYPFAREAWMTTDPEGIYQFTGPDANHRPGWAGGQIRAGFPIYANSGNPVYGTVDFVGIAEFVSRFYKAQHLPPNRKVLVISGGKGSMTFLDANNLPTGSIAKGGATHEAWVTQCQNGVAAAKAAYPGSRVVGVVLCGASNDALATPTRNQSALANAIIAVGNDLRTRVPGAGSAWIAVMGPLSTMTGAGAVMARAANEDACAAWGNAKHFVPPANSSLENLHPEPPKLAIIGQSMVDWAVTRPQPRALLPDFVIPSKSGLPVDTDVVSDPFFAPLSGRGYTGVIQGIAGALVSVDGGAPSSDAQTITMGSVLRVHGRTSALAGTPTYLTVRCTGPDGDTKDAAFAATTAAVGGSTDFRVRSGTRPGFIYTNGLLLPSSGQFFKENP